MLCHQARCTVCTDTTTAQRTASRAETSSAASIMVGSPPYGVTSSRISAGPRATSFLMMKRRTLPSLVLDEADQLAAGHDDLLGQRAIGFLRVRATTPGVVRFQVRYPMGQDALVTAQTVQPPARVSVAKGRAGQRRRGRWGRRNPGHQSSRRATIRPVHRHP